MRIGAFQGLLIYGCISNPGFKSCVKMGTVKYLSGLCAATYLVASLSSVDLDANVEKARLKFGCSALREASAISQRLAARPNLYLCYRGREMEHQKLSYVEISVSGFQQYSSLEAFARKFAPFDDGTKATALALAFTHAEPELKILNKMAYKKIQAPTEGPLVSLSGGGHRVRIYEYAPQQGHCEVPGFYELVIQTWPDGLKREIKRTKIYERSDKRQICVD